MAVAGKSTEVSVSRTSSAATPSFRLAVVNDSEVAEAMICRRIQAKTVFEVICSACRAIRYLEEGPQRRRSFRTVLRRGAIR